MNMFSYYITTHFISSNKDYNSGRNFHSVYQTRPKYSKKKKNLGITYPLQKEKLLGLSGGLLMWSSQPMRQCHLYKCVSEHPNQHNK